MCEDTTFDGKLILAAEDFSDAQFDSNHYFSSYENKIIKKLIAHGPVLIRGGRGSGKSALLKKAYFQSNSEPHNKNIIGIYISLRYLPLLRSEGKEYESTFCSILSKHIQAGIHSSFEQTNDISILQKQLYDLAINEEKRIILFFDDAAHIGRETSLKEFFDIFRMLSSNVISCKAAIYPGVTEFGMRFDLLNDANVIDIARNDEHPYFSEFFDELIKLRYNDVIISKNISVSNDLEFAKFMGKAVAGNVRAFIFAMNYLNENTGDTIGLQELENTLKHLASEYYWPLLEELEPKLGKYEPLVPLAKETAEIVFILVAESMDKPDYGVSCLIHRDNLSRMKKIFEILEYSGFMIKKESSRAMKSGGRGARYALNLCNLLENMPNSRLTRDLFKKWLAVEKQYVQIFRKSKLDDVSVPELEKTGEIAILNSNIDILITSKAYPYGLTVNKKDALKQHGFIYVKDLFSAPDEEILEIPGISTYWLSRIKSVVGQAIWM